MSLILCGHRGAAFLEALAVQPVEVFSECEVGVAPVIEQGICQVARAFLRTYFEIRSLQLVYHSLQ